jgi:hypothetical protein
MKAQFDRDSKYYKLEDLYKYYYKNSYAPVHNALFDVHILKKCFYWANKDDDFWVPLEVEDPIKCIRLDEIYDLTPVQIRDIYSIIFLRKNPRKFWHRNLDGAFFFNRIKEMLSPNFDIGNLKPFLEDFEVEKLNSGLCKHLIRSIHEIMSNNLEENLLQHCFFLLTILEKINLDIWLIHNKPGGLPWERDYDAEIWFDKEKAEMLQKIANLHKRCFDINPKLAKFFEISPDDFDRISGKIDEVWD